jgi:hypothetical protein
LQLVKGCVLVLNPMVQGAVVDARFPETHPDIALFGALDDGSWITQASYTVPGAGHVSSGQSGADVTSKLRSLVRRACTLNIAAATTFNSVFGGEWGPFV